MKRVSASNRSKTRRRREQGEIRLPCDAKMKKTRGPMAVIEKSPRREVKSPMVPTETLGEEEMEVESKRESVSSQSCSRGSKRG